MVSFVSIAGYAAQSQDVQVISDEAVVQAEVQNKPTEEVVDLETRAQKIKNYTKSLMVEKGFFNAFVAELLKGGKCAPALQGEVVEAFRSGLMYEVSGDAYYRDVLGRLAGIIYWGALDNKAIQQLCDSSMDDFKAFEWDENRLNNVGKVAKRLGLIGGKILMRGVVNDNESARVQMAFVPLVIDAVARCVDASETKMTVKNKKRIAQLLKAACRLVWVK